jgi:hypothetical protein
MGSATGRTPWAPGFFCTTAAGGITVILSDIAKIEKTESVFNKKIKGDLYC